MGKPCPNCRAGGARGGSAPNEAPKPSLEKPVSSALSGVVSGVVGSREPTASGEIRQRPDPALQVTDFLHRSALPPRQASSSSLPSGHLEVKAGWQ